MSAVLTSVTVFAQSESSPPEITATLATPPATGEDAPIVAAPKPALPARIAGPAGLGFKTLVQDHALLWTSPFRSGRSTAKILVPLAGATAAALLFDHPISAQLPYSKDQIRYSKNVSQAGTYYSLGAAAGVLIAAGGIAGDRHVIETGLLAAEALAHTESISQMLKFAAGRERPDFGDHNGRFWRREQSFPSGHSMATWAIATVISREYHHRRWIRYGAYAFPVIISAARMGARRHFLSDVVAGGSLGYLIGGWIYDRHHDPSLGGAAIRRRGVAIAPDVRYDPRSGGFAASVTISR